MQYKCLTDNTCNVTPYTHCTKVPGGCVAGTAGCRCGPNRICATPFTCNATSNYCEGASAPSCVMGAPGCACTPSMPCAAPPAAAGKKRYIGEDAFIRCQDALCRVQANPDRSDASKYPTCARGSDGCECRAASDVDGRCNAGLKCADDSFCTVGCKLGSLGCACHIEGGTQCMGAAKCRANRCVVPEKLCDAATVGACALGSLGCCCTTAGTCATDATNAQGVTNEDGSVTTVGSVCSSDRCTSEQVTLANSAAQQPTLIGSSTSPPIACTSISVEALCKARCMTAPNVASCTCVNAVAKIVCKIEPTTTSEVTLQTMPSLSHAVVVTTTTALSFLVLVVGFVL